MILEPNSEQHEETQGKDFLDIMCDFAIGLSRQETVEEIIRNVVDSAISKLGYVYCRVYLLDEKGEYLIEKASSCNIPEKGNLDGGKVGKVRVGEGIVGTVAHTLKAKTTNDQSFDKNNTAGKEVGISKITVPIIHDERLIGVIDSEHPEKNYLACEHLKLLTAIASITALKIVQAEQLEKLRMKQFRTDLIYSHTYELTFLVGVEPNDTFRYLSIGQAYLDAISLTKAKLIGKSLEEVWDKERTEFFTSKYKQAIKSRGPITYEVTYENVEPQIIIETTIFPVFNDKGNCLNISGISRNVTESKKVEQALKESKEQFESLFEYSANAIFVHDFTKITNVNQAFLELFGYENKSDVLGKPPIQTLVFQEDIEKVLEVRKKRSTDGRAFDPGVRLVKRDGSVFIAEIYVSMVELGGRPHLRITVSDITERKHAEVTLRESEEKYRTLFENSLDGIYKSTPQGRFVEVNPALVRMLGYASEKELKSIDIKKELYFKEGDRKIMASHEEDQYCLRKKDGSQIWVEDQGYYEYDEKGNILFHHGILRDVSAKIAKQTELRNLMAMTADQNVRLQNFAYIVSHNIRSHSSNMTSLVHFMEAAKCRNEKEELFEMLKTSTVKLEETIKNLNEIITVNRNFGEPKEQRHLYNEIKNTLKVLNGDIRENEVQVSVDVPKDIVIQVIPAYLDSILLNVFSNAIKYKSSDRRPVLIISTDLEEDFIVLSVRDNGLGLDLQRHSDKIFGMYATFHNRKDSRGFGLYITKNQIEAMNGKIKVESKVGKGSTFKVYFSTNNKKSTLA